MFLTAYFDESGTHGDSPVSVVAGYLATTAQWRVFETRWRKMLRAAGIDVFHMVDLENFRGEFQGWSEEQRRKLIREATRIIRTQTEMGVGLATLVQDFENTVTLPFQALFGGIYGWCGWFALDIAAQWAADAGNTNPINYIFEAGARGRHELDRFIATLRKFRRGKLVIESGNGDSKVRNSLYNCKPPIFYPTKSTRILLIVIPRCTIHLCTSYGILTACW